MAINKYTVVDYTGTNVGPLYLEDVQPRAQLGRAVQGQIGQDLVINPGDKVALVNTGAVLMSQEKGTIKLFSTDNTEQLAGIVSSMGGTVYRNSGLTGVDAALNGTPTGLTAPLALSGVDTLAGVTGLQRSGTVGTKTDPAQTIGDF